MSVTKVHSIKSVQSLVYYLLYGRGQQYKDNIRNGTDRAAAVFATATTNQFAAFGQQITQTYGRKVQAFSYVQSFSRDEFDIHKPEDVQTVNDLGFELAQRMHPEAHTLVVTHIDGKGECLHNHIVILNHNQQTGTALRGYQLARQVRAANDQLMKEHGLKIVTPNRRKTSQREYWLDRKGKLAPNDWEGWLKATLTRIITQEKPTSLTDYIDKCATHHITVQQTDHGGNKGLVYHAKAHRIGKDGKPRLDANGHALTRTRRRKASKLGTGYTLTSLTTLFKTNLAQAEAEQQATDDAPFDIDKTRAEITSLFRHIEPKAVGYKSADEHYDTVTQMAAESYGRRDIQPETGIASDEVAKAMLGSKPSSAADAIRKAATINGKYVSGKGDRQRKLRHAIEQDAKSLINQHKRKGDDLSK